MSTNNIAPLQIQTQLRKAAFYGCAICGSPILEYVHIVPYRNIQAFLPENMVALCPYHSMRYDLSEISESTLRSAKADPYNKVHQQDTFSISSQEMYVNVGKRIFVNTSRILVVDDFDIISIKREDGKYVLFDINFFDKLNNLIAIVSENGWTAERGSRDWSVMYKPRHLTIKNNSKDILFDAEIKNDKEITIVSDGLYYNGSPLRITENEILLNNDEIAIDLKGTELRNYEVGIAAETL
jgi:hypothetical protein